MNMIEGLSRVLGLRFRKESSAVKRPSNIAAGRKSNLIVAGVFISSAVSTAVFPALEKHTAHDDNLSLFSPPVIIDEFPPPCFTFNLTPPSYASEASKKFTIESDFLPSDLHDLSGAKLKIETDAQYETSFHYPIAITELEITSIQHDTRIVNVLGENLSFSKDKPVFLELPELYHYKGVGIKVKITGMMHLPLDPLEKRPINLTVTPVVK